MQCLSVRWQQECPLQGEEGGEEEEREAQEVKGLGLVCACHGRPGRMLTFFVCGLHTDFYGRDRVAVGLCGCFIIP